MPTTIRDVQVIDVRDVAAWIIGSGRDRLFGTFGAVDDRHSLGETLDAAARLAPSTLHFCDHRRV